jgi:protein involved in polysaccharide export with SLBB domain
MLMRFNNRIQGAGFFLACMFGLLIAITSTVSVAATLIDNPVFLDAEPGTGEAAPLAIADNEQLKLRAYTIQPSNLIEIRVSQDSALNTVVRVDANGDIPFPLIGMVKVRGATPEQLEKQIAELLEKDYIRNPQVSVLLKEYAKPKINVTGSVIVPGTYEITGRTTLLEAIALAGGPSEKADLSKIRHTKTTMPSPAAPTKQSIVYNAQSIINAKQEDPEVGDGDNIHVEENIPVAIEGAVIKPGLIYPSQTITLKQIVIMAGGVKPLADSTEISIYSTDATGEKSEKIYNLDEIAEGKAEDPLLQPGQIVVVGECAAKYKIFNKTICSKKK